MQQSHVPLLSVIIPVYNASATIRQCLDSVCTQNISDLEVLCVDDGSTDDSVAILEEYSREHGCVRVIRQSNRSAGAARNNGLSYARGKYIHFLDADDLLCPGIYKSAIDRLETTGASVCMFQYKLLNSVTGQETEYPCLLNGKERVTSLRREPAFFLYNMVAPWNKVYRRDWVEDHALRFDEIPCGNDRGFYYRMLTTGGKIALSMDYGVSYRINNSAALTGSNRWRHFDSLFHAWDTSAKAVGNEDLSVRAMLLDCVVRDLLSVLQRTPNEHRAQVLAQLRDRLAQTDFTVLKALPLPCVWKREVQLIMDGVDPYTVPVRVTDRLKKLAAACRIWGIRGCIVKLFAKM